MKKVRKYEAKDGSLFDKKENALARDRLLELEEWYEGNKLYGRYEGCRIEWEDFIEWLKVNKEEIKRIIR